MQTAILPIPYTSAVDDPWWVRFAQPELVDDTATVSETADLLDALYSIDPCDASEADQVEPTAEDVAAAVVQAYSLAICAQETDGSITLPVRMYRSHQETPYILRVSGGRVVGKPVITPEEVTAILTVEQQSSLTLEYPVIDGFTAEWIGTVAGADAVPVDGPTIHRSGNTLYWSATVTGTLQVAFVSRYDALSVLVDGVDGELGQATIRAFYHGACTTYEVQLPEPAETDASLCPDIHWNTDPTPANVTCYQAVTVRKLCSCSKQETDSYTYDKIVPCPDYAPTRCPGSATDCMHLLGSVVETEYVECEEDEGYAVADREFYKQTCCEYPSVTLPRCPEEIESYSGGKPIEKGEIFWRGLYGEKTRFIPVSPEKGCGKHITSQVVEAQSCCDGVPELLWDVATSADVIVDVGVVAVVGGQGPFKWSLTGDHFSFSASGVVQAAETVVRSIAVYLDDNACGICQLTCVDACEQETTGSVRSADGHWRVLTNDELCAFPRDTWYEPDAILNWDGQNPSPTALPGTTPQNSSTWLGGVLFKDLGEYRVYTWFSTIHVESVSPSTAAAVDSGLDSYSYGFQEYDEAMSVCYGVGWFSGHYLDCYPNELVDLVKSGVEGQILRWAPNAVLQGWQRSTLDGNTWRMLGIQYPTYPYIRGAGFAIGPDGFGYYPVTRIYTWSCV